MAGLPVIADTFRVALDWVFGAETAENVIHIRTSTSGKTATDVFNLVATHATGTMWDHAPSTSGIGSLTITKLDGSSVTETTSTSFTSNFLGQQTGDGVPALATLIKLTTALRGRSFRGRIFLPFTAEAVNDNGFIQSTPQSTLTTAWRNFQVAISSDVTTPSKLVVASYKLSEANDVTLMSCERPLATQRRRQGRLR